MPVEVIDGDWLSFPTPLGNMVAQSTDGAVVRVNWCDRKHRSKSNLLRHVAEQLKAYFAGELQQFDLPLAPAGTEFQQRVYAAMSAIPYGQTQQYGDLARLLGTAAQPVGQACGSNPIAIIIPCHRVLAADGMGGFSAPDGIEKKMALLKIENAFPFLL